MSLPGARKASLKGGGGPRAHKEEPEDSQGGDQAASACYKQSMCLDRKESDTTVYRGLSRISPASTP